MRTDLQVFKSTPVAHALDALVLVYDNPLETFKPHTCMVISPGVSIASLAPTTPSPLVCRYNGQFILRRSWCLPVLPGDIVEFHILPQGGGGKSNPLRTILQIALAIAIIVAAPYLIAAYGAIGAAAATMAINLVGNALINALVPLPSASGPGGASQSPSYSVNLAANSARRDQPLPIIYGRMKITPDFASQPYSEYVESTDDDQYFYAFYCIGEGRFSFNGIEGPEALLLDDTPLDHFSDVQYNWLPPGTPPTLVDPAVVTALEVSGQELKTGKYVGGFTASGPKALADQIGVDIVFAGLGISDSSGNFSNKTVTIRFEYREVDDFGTPVGSWATLATQSITDATANQVRRSYTYSLPSPKRVEIRAVRTDVFTDNRNHLNTPTWQGLRAYLSQVPDLSPTATHLEIRVRASEQLNGMSQRKITAIVRRMLPVWNPDTGWSAELQETRSIAWAAADVWRNSVYGEGLPDSRIDLAELHRLDQIWSVRQDRCDIIFDSFTDTWTAVSGILQAGRATPFRRGPVRSVSRDSWQSLPRTAFTARDIAEGSFSTKYIMPNRETADGVIIEYFDNRVWDFVPITCPCPGVTTPTNPMRIRVPAITGATHAEREGLYRAAVNTYRRKISSWKSDMLALIPPYGSAIAVAPSLSGWMSGGDVVDWDVGTLTMTLSEPPPWLAGSSHYISIGQSFGDFGAPIEVRPGPAENQVILASAPVEEPETANAGTERPRYYFGSTQQIRKVVKLIAIKPDGRTADDEGQPGTPIFSLTAINDDERIHTYDNHLLPTGSEQDPVDPGESVGGGGGEAIIVNINSRTISHTDSILGPADLSAGFSLLTDGRLRTEVDGSDYAYPSNEWFYGRPVETSIAAAYEARATLMSGDTPTTGTLGTWMDCASTQSWVLAASLGEAEELQSVLLIEVRSKATEVVEDTATITLFLRNNAVGA